MRHARGVAFHRRAQAVLHGLQGLEGLDGLADLLDRAVEADIGCGKRQYLAAQALHQAQGFAATLVEFPQLVVERTLAGGRAAGGSPDLIGGGSQGLTARRGCLVGGAELTRAGLGLRGSRGGALHGRLERLLGRSQGCAIRRGGADRGRELRDIVAQVEVALLARLRGGRQASELVGLRFGGRAGSRDFAGQLLDGCLRLRPCSLGLIQGFGRRALLLQGSSPLGGGYGVRARGGTVLLGGELLDRSLGGVSGRAQLLHRVARLRDGGALALDAVRETRGLAVEVAVRTGDLRQAVGRALTLLLLVDQGGLQGFDLLRSALGASGGSLRFRRGEAGAGRSSGLGRLRHRLVGRLGFLDLLLQVSGALGTLLDLRSVFGLHTGCRRRLRLHRAQLGFGFGQLGFLALECSRRTVHVGRELAEGLAALYLREEASSLCPKLGESTARLFGAVGQLVLAGSQAFEGVVDRSERFAGFVPCPDYEIDITLICHHSVP
ncbi:hypothetical protein D3C87_559470 [compost metagenome]